MTGTRAGGALKALRVIAAIAFVGLGVWWWIDPMIVRSPRVRAQELDGQPQSNLRLVALHAPKTVIVGDSVVFSGKLKGLIPGVSETIRAESPVGEKTTIVVAGLEGEESLFTLNAGRAVAPGLYTWTLRVANERIPLGVEVIAPKPPSVRIVASAPSFDVGRLQRWLTEKGAPVSVRTRVSAERVRVQAANGAPEVSESATASEFNAVDLLIVDQVELGSLRAEEHAAVDAAVREHGMGVLVLANGHTPQVDDTLFPWRTKQVPVGDGERLARVRWQSGETLAEPATILPGDLDLNGSQRAVIRDPQDRIVAVRQAYGRGWVAATWVTQTWRWPQGGHGDQFAAYWSNWLRLLSKPASEVEAWENETSDGVEVVDIPIRLCWRTAEADVPLPANIQIQAPSGTLSTLFLNVDHLANGEATARFWPREAGWHRVQRDASSMGKSVKTVDVFHVNTPAEARALGVEAIRMTTDAMTPPAQGADPASAGTAGGRFLETFLPVIVAAVLLFSLAAVWWLERLETSNA